MKDLVAYYRMREAMEARCAAARANLIRGNHLNDEVWAEAFGTGGFNLEDGHARIFILTKWRILYVYKRLRLEEEWLAPLAQEVDAFKEFTRWPRGTLPKSNPWKKPYFTDLVVAAPERDKETGQFKVVFPVREKSGERKSLMELARLYKARGDREVSVFNGVTYFFEGGMNRVEGMPGWLVPRKQQASRPWKEGDKVQPSPPIRNQWAPWLEDNEIEWLALGLKTRVIRSLHERYADALKSGQITGMDIKRSIDTLIEDTRSR